MKKHGHVCVCLLFSSFGPRGLFAFNIFNSTIAWVKICSKCKVSKWNFSTCCLINDNLNEYAYSGFVGIYAILLTAMLNT